MIYKKKVTRENIDYSLAANLDRNKIHHDSGKAREFFEIWKRMFAPEFPSPNYNFVIVPGIMQIDILDTIIKEYILGVSKIRFLSPLIVEDKPGAFSEIEIDVEQGRVDNPFVPYSVKIREKGRDIFSGNIVATDKKSYDFITKEEIDGRVKLRQLPKMNENMKTIESAFNVDKTIIEPWCKSIDMSPEQYHEKYGEEIARMAIKSKIPAKLFELVENESGFFLYKDQEFKLLKSSYNENFKMSGIKENFLNGNLIYNIKMTIESAGIPLIESYTKCTRVAAESA